MEKSSASQHPRATGPTQGRQRDAQYTGKSKLCKCRRSEPPTLPPPGGLLTCPARSGRRGAAYNFWGVKAIPWGESWRLLACRFLPLPLDHQAAGIHRSLAYRSGADPLPLRRRSLYPRRFSDSHSIKTSLAAEQVCLARPRGRAFFLREELREVICNNTKCRATCRAALSLTDEPPRRAPSTTTLRTLPRFWFRFIFPSTIRMGGRALRTSSVSTWTSWFGQRFPAPCRETLWLETTRLSRQEPSLNGAAP